MPKTKASEPSKDVLREGPEICLWMAAFGCLTEINDIVDDWRSAHINQETYFRRVNKMLVELAEIADATTRFEVVLPVVLPHNYKSELVGLDDAFIDITFYPTFWKWFNWWDDYIRVLRAAPLNEIQRVYALAMERLSEVEKYRPSGTWLDYRNTPGIMLVGLKPIR